MKNYFIFGMLFSFVGIYGASGSASDGDNPLLKVHDAGGGASDSGSHSDTQELKAVLKALKPVSYPDDSDRLTSDSGPIMKHVGGHPVEVQVAAIGPRASSSSDAALAARYKRTLKRRKKLAAQSRQLEAQRMQLEEGDSWKRADEKILAAEIQRRADGGTVKK